MAGTVLLLGGHGLVGNAINKAFVDGGWDVFLPSSNECNLKCRATLADKIKTYSPQIVVNCSALVGHRVCEEHPLQAFEVNTLGPKLLAELCCTSEIKLVQISTSSVFSGEKSLSYATVDSPAPVNVYGGSKYLGEQFALVHCRDVFVIRLPMIFGAPANGKKCFLSRMADQLEKGESVRASVDEWNTPIFSMDAAAEVVRIVSEEKCGLYHVSGNEMVSLFDLVSRVKDQAGWPGKIVPVSRTEFSSSYKVPAQGGLQASFAEKLPELTAALKQWLSFRRKDASS